MSQKAEQGVLTSAHTGRAAWWAAKDWRAPQRAATAAAHQSAEGPPATTSGPAPHASAVEGPDRAAAPEGPAATAAPVPPVGSAGGPAQSAAVGAAVRAGGTLVPSAAVAVAIAFALIRRLGRVGKGHQQLAQLRVLWVCTEFPVRSAHQVLQNVARLV